ncbi:regulator of volume decrease after cellular swelling-domain-containing protein [Mycena belliarum]|uniref:Regulator of volume decrease after cellular swelling-domain-containing protein n=1 Tax=Mycena belliarum TaxID=1033014 RepID=A0AAD6XW18_9AGAR|nr:regulator of volume decrease after cellular swelling-domain-containing protein [Mycena belliae]
MPAITLIDCVPPFVSREKHAEIVAQTPSSFADIPPVLQLKDDDVSVIFDPPFDGFSTEDGALGTLFVVESALVFMSATGRGVQIHYPAITLHAISRAESGSSIYCQLDEIPGESEVMLSENDTDDMRELSIIPQSIASLEPIFEALSRCAALHPDQATASDDEMDDAFIDGDSAGFEAFTGEGDQELSQAGRATLEHLESIITYPAEMNRDGL